MKKYRMETLAKHGGVSSACSTCRRKMELTLYEKYSKQMREKDEQNQEILAEMAYGMILRAAPIAFSDATGKKGEELYPFMRSLVDVIDRLGPESGLLEHELYERTGVMVVTTDEGLIFGTKEEYISNGWEWPSEDE